jgi:hypothetical protein
MSKTKQLIGLILLTLTLIWIINILNQKYPPEPKITGQISGGVWEYKK